MHKNFNPKLLEILRCPKSKGELFYNEENQELICYESKLAYKIINGIPIMLIEKARSIN
jgi:uncharacterized protein YbaR (Trm112 family)